MSSSNFLLEPIPELTTALRNNAWGIQPESTVIVTECFPVTPEDVESVREESNKQGGSSSRVKGKAKVVTLEGEALTVVLGQGGFTVSYCQGLSSPSQPRVFVASRSIIPRLSMNLKVSSLTSGRKRHGANSRTCIHDIRDARSTTHRYQSIIRRGDDSGSGQTIRRVLCGRFSRSTYCCRRERGRSRGRGVEVISSIEGYVRVVVRRRLTVVPPCRWYARYCCMQEI